jgi:uncharacterized protein (TIGR03435 family)
VIVRARSVAVTRLPVAVALSVFSLPAVAVVAQQSKPRFEVASVRPQATPRTAAEITDWIRAAPGGRLAGSHSTLIRLITYAHDVKDFQVIGPGWIRTTYYAVDAKAASPVPVDQLRLMLRSLLEDRFAFAAHQEQREMPYLALVRARKDRAPGPRLRQLDPAKCDGRPDLNALIREQLPAPAIASRNRIAGACVGLRDLAEQVSLMLDTLVIDKTGLDALEEQLGLKLESTRGPVDVLVIDSVSEPTDN